MFLKIHSKANITAIRISHNPLTLVLLWVIQWHE